jgi:hypothetical protein
MRRHFDQFPSRAKLLSKDGARRIAPNIAKPPGAIAAVELLMCR